VTLPGNKACKGQIDAVCIKLYRTYDSLSRGGSGPPVEAPEAGKWHGLKNVDLLFILVGKIENKAPILKKKEKKTG
jgi:hypothetical protein